MGDSGVIRTEEDRTIVAYLSALFSFCDQVTKLRATKQTTSYVFSKIAENMPRAFFEAWEQTRHR